MSYARDFMGIPARLRGEAGRDPNFRGGYRGMRMRSEGWQAAYGWHRWTHEGDLGPHGAFGGVHGGRPRRAAPGQQDGGVRSRYDRELLRTFNASSERLRDPTGRDRLPGGPRPVSEREHRFGFDDRYAGGGGGAGFTDYGGPGPR
jgi:hypothetical protein